MTDKEKKQISTKNITLIKKLNKEIQAYTKSLDDADLYTRLNAQRKILFYQKKVQTCLCNLRALNDDIIVSEVNTEKALIAHIKGCSINDISVLAEVAFGGKWALDLDEVHVCTPDENYKGAFYPKKEE